MLVVDVALVRGLSQLHDPSPRLLLERMARSPARVAVDHATSAALTHLGPELAHLSLAQTQQRRSRYHRQLPSLHTADHIESLPLRLTHLHRLRVAQAPRGRNESQSC